MPSKHVSAKVPGPLATRLTQYVEEDQRRTVNSVLVAALREFFSGEGPPQIEAPAVGESGLFRRVRELEELSQAEDADYDVLITSASALYWDYLALVRRDYSALHAWAAEGGDIPTSLCDPMAAVTALEAVRKLKLAAHKVTTDQALSKDEIVEVFQRFAEIMTEVVSEVLKGYLPSPGTAREAQQQILDRCREGWSELDGVLR